MGSLDNPPCAVAENHGDAVRIVLNLMDRLRTSESFGSMRNQCMAVLIGKPASLLTADAAQETQARSFWSVTGLQA